MEIISGKKLSAEILADVKNQVALLPFVPKFSDVLVGDDPASVKYVEMKARMAESAGVSFRRANFPRSITTEELINEINILNKEPEMCGIIVQLPLPEHIDKERIFDAIDPDLDVDCLGSIASRKFYGGDDSLGFPTALSCMMLLDSTNIDLSNKKILVLGQGMLVGKPVTALLRSRGLSPSVVSNDTQNKEDLLKQADIIISGIGQGKYIRGGMVKEGVIIIDAGTSEANGSIVGDVDFDSVKNVASFLTPSPGGVGPVTVAMLLNNVLTVAKRRASMDEARHDFS
jgi:methylenetetrahydrofolate dehydrogenase (NADP+)/methenyltetrahydrofolate cyclohydrolase